MREVPTPAWITSQGLSGPTYLINQYSGRGALVVPGLLSSLPPRSLVCQRSTRHVCRNTRYRSGGHGGDLVFRLPFPIQASETWLGAEYVLINRLVRLDDLVKASVTSGSYTHLTLRDAHGGSIQIQTSATLPHVRPQVVRGIVQGLQRGLRLDERTARALGLKIQKF